MVCCVSTILVKPTVKPGSNVGGGSNLRLPAKAEVTVRPLSLSPFSLRALNGGRPHIAASRLRVLVDCGHFSNWSAPDGPPSGERRDNFLNGTALTRFCKTNCSEPVIPSLSLPLSLSTPLSHTNTHTRPDTPPLPPVRRRSLLSLPSPASAQYPAFAVSLS